MDFKDKPQFKVALDRMAQHFGQKINLDTLEFYYSELKGYPLPVLKRAINVAIDMRDPDDKFLRNSIISVTEIRRALEYIEESENKNRKIGCENCDWKGWLISKDSYGRLIARPCKCLYNEAKKALEKRKRPGSLDEHNDRYRKLIIDAYEMYQKKYGGL